jgi:hypothetical protein
MSRDADWCLEWMAYVLDQGVENFPQSTQKSPSFDSSKIDQNSLVKGDLYSGPLIKYLPPNSFYEKTWDPNLDWKPNPNLPSWVIGNPFTLPQEGNAENVGIVDNVAQGIFVPDISSKNGVIAATMIFEFENKFKAKDFFDATKMEIQNKIKSDSLIEDISRQGTVYYDDCVAYLKNFDMADESSRFVCVRDNYLVSVSANQFGGYVTDNFYDTVLPEELVWDISKEIGKNIDVTFQKIDDKKTGTVSITGRESCITLVDKAEWKNEACVAKVLNVDAGEILTVARGVSLINSNGVFKNNGTINVLGSISNWGTFENYGAMNISGQVSISENKIINKGIIVINDDGSLVVMSDGMLENYGTISNNDDLINFGEIKNFCEGEIIGNSIGNDFGTGKKPINQIPCGSTSNKEPTTEEKDEITQLTNGQRTINSDTKNSEEDESNAGSAALGAFIVLGIPAILIGLFVARRKMKKSQEQKIRDSEWKGV